MSIVRILAIRLGASGYGRNFDEKSEEVRGGRMKKYVLSTVMAVLMLMFLLPHTGQAASSGTTITLDNQKLANADVLTVNQTTMVPIRVVSEQLGYSVKWNQAAGQVTIGSGANTVVLTINQRMASVNGALVSLTEPAMASKQTTYVPLRFVSAQMGLQVKWDNAAKNVFLFTAGNPNAGQIGATPSVPSDGGNLTPIVTPVGDKAQLQAISFSDNRLMVTTDKLVTVKDSVLTGPNRILLELSNTGFGPALGNGLAVGDVGTISTDSASNISQVRYFVPKSNPNVVQVVIDLKSANTYKLSKEGTSVFVSLDKVAAPNTNVGGNGKKVLVIDAGHGAHDPGAVGNGIREKDINLAIALKVEAIMKKNPKVDVVMSRSDDTFLELKERVRVAKNVKADVFISIHNNSGSAAASGTETYYQRDSSKTLATTLHKYILAATGFKDRKVQYGNFHVIRETDMPAALLEIGFVSNAGDASQLKNDAFQQRVAEAIAKGLLEYMGV
ncbi:N-acetylmuramoyl-L-alanine amidase [Saccharibacillus sp. JS10]|uniref:N-acetylmuramoyl-L-alanine amidase n=1 Tax=Saccharibacillus sp. JS10 TaxID=2950552 RepID=UPI00210A4E89|nr:N-acetylmuramoyl-L-alanine amidase [Saccharibacillus sp. JS10]MCQ4085750.1 N-acetylmuramoyl-L-alanine amidase family protein [Saccharibacillus sp. JS10]